MDGFDNSNIIFLFDRYSKESQNLHTSFKMAGCHCPAFVIDEEAFLPEDVMSVYEYFLGDFKNNEKTHGKPRYFNEIEVPEYWEISGNNSGGKINDLNRERGKIFYAEPLNLRLVKVVDWYDERSVVRSSDHYNRYGVLYARTIFNEKGQKYNKTYFSSDGKEVIVENYVTGDIILNDGDIVRFFRSKLDFIIFFFEKTGYAQRRIFYNSLSTPFFVSERLTAPEKRDILFWQEPVYDEIPGNMQVIFRRESSRTEEIQVQKPGSYDKLLGYGANPDMLHKLGYVYPFEKENEHRMEVLICTNSENVAHCEKIVKAFPNLRFHIAALTEMSSKLMAVGGNTNVKLYPSVKLSLLEELFDQCDYYLDINHESEIVSAVQKAFLHNHLIFAFQETMHNADYVAKDHIYPESDVERMIQDLKAAVDNEDVCRRELQKQREAAMEEEIAAYQRLL